MSYKILTIIVFFTTSFAIKTTDGSTIKNNSNSIIALKTDNAKTITIEEKIELVYTDFVEKNTSVPSSSSFQQAMIGYYKLKDKNLAKKEVLTIIDFTLSSTQKRMWVLDMKNHEVLFHSLVAHGKNTGGEFATKFSNTVNSLQSSLGFFVTGETYFGKNGLSMFIDGQEKDFNSNARSRYVVMHGADYANASFIPKMGRLGRSYGCPAVPTALTKDIIGAIKNKSVLFIYSNDDTYEQKSKMIQA